MMSWSTVSKAVLVVHNDIIRAIDNGQLTVMLFLDLSSAFDTVDHDIMLSILHRRLPVEGAALNWFHSYQTDRSQTFSVGDSNSDPHSVSCSVPQGPVLGPVKFVAFTEYVLDLFDRHKVNHHMYADDQHIYLHTIPDFNLTPRKQS